MFSGILKVQNTMIVIVRVMVPFLLDPRPLFRRANTSARRHHFAPARHNIWGRLISCGARAAWCPAAPPAVLHWWLSRSDKVLSAGVVAVHLIGDARECRNFLHRLAGLQPLSISQN